MTLPLTSIILFSVAGFGVLGSCVGLFCFWTVRKQRLPELSAFPRVTFIKPLAGLDDELLLNLKSHLEVDYPGPFELLLGVRSEADAAHPVARAFAEEHKDRVRLLIQEGEPGHNPKVNQLLTLTRAAQGEIIALTDSNVRIPRSYLREVVATLGRPGVGIATHPIAGVGEQRLGALMDNMMLNAFVAPMVTAGTVLLRESQNIVGKSMAFYRTTLDQLGGWRGVKNFLAEDQRMGVALRQAGLHAAFCPTPVQNVQVNQHVKHFFWRHARWAMIRFRVALVPSLLEPVMNFALVGLVAAAFGWRHPLAWAIELALILTMMGLVQIGALIARGYGYPIHRLLWVPVRDVVYLAAWVRGATLRWVDWRGNRLQVLGKTRLAEREAVQRAKNIQRRGRS